MPRASDTPAAETGARDRRSAQAAIRSYRPSAAATSAAGGRAAGGQAAGEPTADGRAADGRAAPAELPPGAPAGLPPGAPPTGAPPTVLCAGCPAGPFSPAPIGSSVW